MSIFQKSTEKIQVSWKSDTHKVNLHENLRTLMVCCWVIHRIWNVSDKFVEKIKIYNLYSTTFLQNLCHLQDTEEKCWGTRDAIDDNTNTVHALCKMDNQDYTHSEYVIFMAFPRLQWLINCASILCYSALFNHIVKSEDDSIRISWGIVWYDKR